METPESDSGSPVRRERKGLLLAPTTAVEMLAIYDDQALEEVERRLDALIAERRYNDARAIAKVRREIANLIQFHSIT